MADQGEQPNRNRPVQYIPGHRGQHRHLLLDAALALMLLGVGAVAGVTAMGSSNNKPDTDDATQTQVIFLGFVTWLLGVCLLSFMPLAGRFPQAAALLGVAIANANANANTVLRHLQMTSPWN